MTAFSSHKLLTAILEQFSEGDRPGVEGASYIIRTAKESSTVLKINVTNLNFERLT